MGQSGGFVTAEPIRQKGVGVGIAPFRTLDQAQGERRESASGVHPGIIAGRAKR